MSTFMYSSQDPELDVELSETGYGNCPQSFGDVPRHLKISESANLSSNNIPNYSIPNESNSEDFVKPQLKGASEISPFKQAVKGFVINKLSKKVGSSHILYGLTEKIVKRLEEGKDIAPSAEVVQIEKKSLVVPLIEPSPESNIELQPCELKSVLENDFPELANVEEAVECFEELESLVTHSFHQKPVQKKVLSKSLPSTPLHNTNVDISIHLDDSSIHERKSLLEISNISSHNCKTFQGSDLEQSTNQSDEIELKTTKREESVRVKSAERRASSILVTYPENAYIGNSEEDKKPDKYKKLTDAFQNLTTAFVSLPLPYIFLLALLIVHNLKFLSMLYIDYIFDSFVLSYVIYTLLNIWLEKKAQKVPESLSFSKDHLATTAIDLNTDQPMKGSVKILKGEYDPEKTDGYSTEAVNLCIENHCLSISRPYLNDDEDVSTPTETYDLCGAKISLVPQHLEKKRHFLKKHPICVTLPLASKKWEDGSKNFDDLSQEEKRDFISLVELEDGLVERPKQRALYIFALTNREKEAWFHALTKCLTDCDSSFLQNMQIVNTSPTLDFSALSYSSLMEMNADESLAIVDDSSEKDTDIKLSPSEKKLYVYFDDYMKVLWENYQKVLHVVASEDEHKCTSKRTEGQFKSSCCVEWLNVAVGRLFYDFLTQKKWCDKVIVKIQKKLDKIEMPNFVETLQVTDICMGSNLPQLHAVSNPSMDNLGLWFDFDFIYRGSFYMTLKTRLKIPKEKTFKSSDDQENESNKQNADGSEASDEDAASGSKKSPNKFISKLEKWMTHKHFKTVAQSRFVKKYVGDINNMPLTLTVEVNKLEGILSINIPPAPTDRIWFGFHKDPTLSVTASPKVGSTEINMSAVVQMIERKLVNAFKKALVMPHMEDLIIPIMFSPLSDE